MIKRTLFGIVAATLILTGCGGGGGSSAPTYNGPTGAVSLSSTTEGQTAAGFASNEAFDSGLSSVTNIAAPPFVASNTATNFHALSTLAQKYAEIAFKADKSGPNLPVGVTGSQTVNCPSGGSATVTVVAASQTTYTAGDTVTFAYNNCVTSLYSDIGYHQADHRQFYQRVCFLSHLYLRQVNGSTTINWQLRSDPWQLHRQHQQRCPTCLELVRDFTTPSKHHCWCDKSNPDQQLLLCRYIEQHHWECNRRS